MKYLYIYTINIINNEVNHEIQLELRSVISGVSYGVFSKSKVSQCTGVVTGVNKDSAYFAMESIGHIAVDLSQTGQSPNICTYPKQV